MRIDINSKQTDSLLPGINQVLNLDSQVPLYHAKHGRRHPQAIYNISCSTILNNFDSTVADLLQIMKERPFLDPSKTNWDAGLLISQKDLLYSLMEHLDDCDNILACFFPSEDVRNENIFTKSYRRATKEYRDHIGRVVNNLKQEQGRLRSIVFYSDELILPGYFIEGSFASDVVGPVEIIHPGRNTAFSFARDLRYNLFTGMRFPST